MRNGNIIRHQPTAEQSIQSEEIFTANPISDKARISLLDIIDLERLQEIQDTMASVADVASIIIDQTGRPITKPSNFSSIRQFIQVAGKNETCGNTIDKLKEDNANIKRNFVRHQCYNSYFADAVAPLYIGDEHVADWLIGQYDIISIKRRQIAEYSKSINADVETVLKIFDATSPKMPGKFEKVAKIIKLIAEEMSKLGHNHLIKMKEISDRLQAEGKLAESEKILSELFNSVYEGICIIDADDKIEFANLAFARLLAADSPDVLHNTNIYNYFDYEQQKLLSEERKKRRNGKISQYEIITRNLQQEERHILISATPRYDKNGKYIGSYAGVIDITEKKLLEEYAARAKRLETAGRIAAQVAHDFNNLLGPLLVYPQMIKSQLPQDKNEILQLLNDIETAAATMSDINQQLLTLGRRGRHAQELINPDDLLRQIIQAYYEPKDVCKINLNLGPGPKYIKGSSSQLIRAITNIINNAIDAIGHNGEITIKTEIYQDGDHSPHKQNITAGQYVLLTISDNGCGIPDDVMPFIFDPFYSTKTSDHKRGSGLGLSVVFAVVEDHGGYIDVKSKAGQGTSIYISLPVAPDLNKDCIKVNTVLAENQ